MNNTAGELLELLKEIIGTIDELIKVCAKKKRALIEGDTTGLDAIVEEEMDLASRLAGLEERRKEITAQIKEDARLSEIMEGLDSGIKAELEKCRSELMQKLTEQKAANELNYDIAQSNLSYAEFMLSLITGRTRRGPSYTREGYEKGGGARYEKRV